MKPHPPRLAPALLALAPLALCGCAARADVAPQVVAPISETGISETGAGVATDADVRLDTPAAAETAPLERALASVEPGPIAADVAFLADDALEGRGTPSSGQRIAARYLVSRVQRLGFEPGSRDGYLHTFDLESKRVDPQACRLVWEGGPLEGALAYRTQFGVHPYDASSGRYAGEVVYAGEGQDDELAACELSGRWALCVEQRYGRRRSLQREAAGRGALGLVLVGRSGDEAREAPFDEWAELSGRIRPSWPGTREAEDIPCVWLEPGTAALPADLAVGALLPGRLELELAGGGALPLENVAALWPGRGPRADEVLVVTAHYDHMGRNRAGEIMNGADDNASGSAGLLALAEALAAYGPLQRSVLLLWVSAEELGLYGSRAWCEDPRLPEGLRPVADVNLDMLGRNDPLYVEMTPSPDHVRYNPVAAAALELVAAEGFGPATYVDRDFGRSDQISFAERLDLPVVYLSCGEHDDYHEPTDDVERIDADKIARVVRVVLRLLDAIQAAALDAAAQAPR